MSGYQEKGIKLLRIVENEKAIQSFEKALQEDPENVEVHRHIGLAFFNIGDYKKALNHWNKCLQLDPSHHQTWWNLGQLNEILKNFEDAFHNYRQAAATAHESPEKTKRYEEWAKIVSKKY